MPELSVIVPVYKVEPYLEKCIESILAQTFRGFELILVDDGSPDRCPEICDRYAAQDARIRVIHQANSGVSAARNAGLDAAKGSYIGFVDPDDWCAPTMYAQMLQAMQAEAADLVVCGYDYWDEQYRRDEKRCYPAGENEVIDRHELMKRMSDMPPTLRHGVVNKLFRAERLKGLRFVRGLHSSEDVCFLNGYIPQAERTVVVHQPLYQNLVRQGSATHGGLNIDALADSFQVHREMYDTIVSCYPDLRHHSQAFYLDVCLLKYGEAQKKLAHLPEEEQARILPRLGQMKREIKKEACFALCNGEIYWKTRVYYLVF